jgi:hypothetical protein
MFANFIHEKIDSMNQQEVSPEIRYFDEQIIAKKNRSKFTLKKSTTPFLSDDRDYYRETYIAPLPSSTGLSSQSKYNYTIFPNKLNTQLFGDPRISPVLVKVPEHKRLRDDVAISLLHQSLKVNAGTRRRSYQTITAHSISSTSPSPSLAINHLKSEEEATTSHDDILYETHLRVNDELESFFHQSREQYLFFILQLIKLQTRFRYRCEYQQYYRYKHAVQVIERSYRCYAFSLYLWRRIVRRHAISIQRIWRGYSCYLSYQKQRKAWIRFQAYYRQFVCRIVYQTIRTSVIRIQTFWRGVLTRKQQLSYRQLWLQKCRQQILYLWQCEHTPLRYRSVFWYHFTEPTCLHLAIYAEELWRLYHALGIIPQHTSLNTNNSNHTTGRTTPPPPPPPPNLPSLPSLSRVSSSIIMITINHTQFQQAFEHANRLPVMSILKLLSERVDRRELTFKEVFSQSLPDVLKTTPFAHSANIQSLAQREEIDRHHIYEIMSQLEDHQQGGASFSSLYQLLHIDDRKKRKRKLSHYIWILCNEKHANISAEIILSIVQGNEGKEVTNQDWLQTKIHERSRKHCIETVHACLLSLQKTKSNNRAVSSSSSLSLYEQKKRQKLVRLSTMKKFHT